MDYIDPNSNEFKYIMAFALAHISELPDFRLDVSFADFETCTPRYRISFSLPMYGDLAGTFQAGLNAVEHGVPVDDIFV